MAFRYFPTRKLLLEHPSQRLVRAEAKSCCTEAGTVHSRMFALRERRVHINRAYIQASEGESTTFGLFENPQDSINKLITQEDFELAVAKVSLRS